jgi:hypothetical protein
MTNNIEFLNAEIKRVEKKLAAIFVDAGKPELASAVLKGDGGMFVASLSKKHWEEVTFLMDEITEMEKDKKMLLRQQVKAKKKFFGKITLGVFAVAVIGCLVISSKK